MLKLTDDKGTTYHVNDTLPDGTTVTSISWPSGLITVQPPPHGRVIRSAVIHKASVLGLNVVLTQE